MQQALEMRPRPAATNGVMKTKRKPKAKLVQKIGTGRHKFSERIGKKPKNHCKKRGNNAKVLYMW